MESATVFSIKHFAVHDGDGIRTTVFLKGCPLSCVWCHNPEGLDARPQLAYREAKCISCGACAAVCPTGAQQMGGRHELNRSLCRACGACATACPAGALTFYGKRMTVAELLPELIADRDFYKNTGGGVTLSGGECLLYPSFCAELAEALLQEGIRTDIDTCGFVPREAIDAVLPFTDTFLYDIKAIDPEVHRRGTGVTNERILDNLRYLDARGARVEVRYPFIPDYNDGEAEKIAAFLTTLSCVSAVRVLSYHNFATSKYAALALPCALPPALPDPAALAAAVALFRKSDITVKK